MSAGAEERYLLGMVGHMSLIQEEFNRSTGDFILTPGEYEGPLIVDRPCVIDGQQSTIWANSGPVVVVDSAAVTLRNLRIEVTDTQKNGQAAVSLKLNHPNTKLENIEINGISEGVPEEAAGWNIPGVIALGDFAANLENSFTIEFDAPWAAEIVHNLKDVAIAPGKVKSGRNTLSITTSNLRDNTILFGEMLIKTSVARRIYITGKAKAGAPQHTSISPVSGELLISDPLQINPPDEVIAPLVDDEQVKAVSKGQRLSLNQMQRQTIKVVYSHKAVKRPLTVDPYVFLLGKDRKVRSDDDLIFFGNEVSENKAVRVKTDNENAFAAIELSKIHENVDRIAVCMSIYDDASGTNFTCVEAPIIRVFSEDKEQYRFPLDSLTQERTVVAVELYRYKGEWKISFVGGGFKLGLDSLCREYGVEVE